MPRLHQLRASDIFTDKFTDIFTVGISHARGGWFRRRGIGRRQFSVGISHILTVGISNVFPVGISHVLPIGISHVFLARSHTHTGWYGRFGG